MSSDIVFAVADVVAKRAERFPDDVPPPPDEELSTTVDSGAPSLLGKMFNAAALEQMEFDPLTVFVRGLIVEGFGIIAGPPKIGKSWWILDIALAIALGGKALGRIPVDKRRVLLLALEDSKRRLKSRIRVVLGDDAFPAGLDILTAEDIAPGTIAATIAEWLQENPGGLVFLDTLGKARPQRRSGDDPYIADYQFGSRIKKLVDDVPGSALVAVHHTRKMLSEDFLDAISGTQGIAGSADYVLVLRRKRKSPEAFLSITGRDVEENEYALKVDNGCWQLDGETIGEAAAEVELRREKELKTNLGDRSLDALKFVNSRPSTTPTELGAHLGISNKVAGNLLARLDDGGHVVKLLRGTYAPIGGESDESGETAGQASPADSPDSPDSPQLLPHDSDGEPT